MESSKRKGAGRRSLQRKEKSWMKASTAVVMAVVLAAVTVQSAALPEQTPEAETYCGKEAHVHTEECYAPVLVCGFPEETGSPEAEGEQKVLITEDGEQLVNIGETPAVEGQEPAAETESGTPEETQESAAEADGLESVPSEEVPKANELLEAPAGTYLACPLQVHVHSADCLDDFGNNLCGEADFVIHTHNGSCYDAEGNLVCTLPEIKAHTHDDTCYEVRRVLLCGQEETAGHTHTDDCYAWSTELICGQEESAGHTHTEECHQRETVLTCGQEESLGHTHTEECYQTERVLVCTDEFHEHNDSCYAEEHILVCGQEESAGHTHSDACYTTTDMIVCGLEETPGHTHSESCYTQVKGELICGQEESAGHTHTDACFGEEKVKICGQDEVIPHTHTAECYAVLTEDYTEDGTVVPHVHTDACYNAAGWPVCGGLICGQIEVLEHEHGLECFQTVEEQDAEAQDNGAEDTGVQDTGNQTPEVQDTGDQNPETQDTENQEPEDQNTGDQNPEVQDTETEENAGSPEAEQQDTEANQSEIEIGQEEETVHVHTDECYEMELVCGKEEHTHTEECYQEPVHTKTAQGDGYSVTVTYGPEAEIPENAVLTTKEFGEGTEEYAKRYAELTEKLNLDAETAEISESVSAEDSSDESENSDFGDDGEAAEFEDGEEITIAGEETGGTREELSYMRLFDVSFMVDGVEIEPKAPVEVFFTFEDEETEDTNIAHFGQNGVEILQGEAADDVTEEDSEKTIGYTVDSFSPFAKFRSKTVPTNTTELLNTKYPISQINADDMENFEHKKQIDYLGDNDGTVDKNNPDTTVDDNQSDPTNTEDLYRLYLDIVGKSEPVDVLLVVDRSQSMTTNIKGTNERRDKAVIKILNGDNGHNGLIQKFLANNTGKTDEQDMSWLAVSWFGGVFYTNKEPQDGDKTDESFSTDYYTIKNYKYTEDAGISQNWTTSATCAPESLLTGLTYKGGWSVGGDSHGTNYSAGLMKAHRMLQDSRVKSNGHRKVVIFISDGIPTFYHDTPTEDLWNGESDTWTRHGSAREEMAAVYPKSYIDTTEAVFDTFIKKNSGIEFYTVGINMQDNVVVRDITYPRKTLLNYMSNKARTGEVILADDANTLENKIKELVFPSDVSITDTLSAYVDYYKTQPDPKVTMTSPETSPDKSKTWTLWENGKFVDNTASGGPNGNLIVQSVTNNGKEVQVKFKEGYSLMKDWTYTLSFNVQVTDEAFDAYAPKAEYMHKGDSGEDGGHQPGYGTDYGQNTTSSGQLGFHSNNEARVTYKVNDKDGGDVYDHPVVQVWRSKLTIKKVDEEGNALTGVKFALINDKKPEEVKIIETKNYGSIDLGYLLSGNYTLKETSPSGYWPIGDIEFTVSRGRITLTNKSKSELGTPVKTGKLKDGDLLYSYTLTVKNAPYETNLKLIKKDAKVDKTLLEGAIFLLESGTWKDGEFTVGENIIGEKISGSYTTNSEGEILIEKLHDGAYRLTETTPPHGYYLLKKPIIFVVENGEIKKSKLESAPDEVKIEVTETRDTSQEYPVHTFTITIPNNSGAVLPDTGGPGTVLYTMAGVSLLLAGFMYSLQVRERRRRSSGR